MAVLGDNMRPTKKLRRRVTADLRDFVSFPSASEKDVFQGPFRSNVKTFLKNYAWIPPHLLPAATISKHVVIWRMSFTIGGGDSKMVTMEEDEEKKEDTLPVGMVVDLNIVEEDVAKSKYPYCEQCKVVGWSGHPVCAKRYHFIIRNVGNPAATSLLPKCVKCRSSLDVSVMRCGSCNIEVTEDDLQDWTHQHFEDSTHLLHGLIHSNGHGHLLRVNGREGGSKVLRGRDIMDFWDRLCKMLRVRKVTVMDVSTKYGLEYRLLHAISTGQPWYGEWGYMFGTGSFAITEATYKEAINTLSSLPISSFFTHSRLPRSRLLDTIVFYSSLSEQQLLTVRDLFHYLLHLIHQAHKQVGPEFIDENKCYEANLGVVCAWTREDVRAVEEAMFKVLRSVPNGRWISSRALKGATYHVAESTELLNYCLKGLKHKLVGEDLVVAVRCNADTNSMEYRLEASSGCSSAFQVDDKPSQQHLIRDLKFLYDAILNPKTMHLYKAHVSHDLAMQYATILLDCKRFIKNYDRHVPDIPNQRGLFIWCEIELADQVKDCPSPPPELIVLQETTDIARLKMEAARAFQEVYLAFKLFQVEKLQDYDRFKNSTQVKLLLGKYCTVKIRGKCRGDHDKTGEFRMERGTEKWVVDCHCGAKDDDGERMLACDSCGVWKHTRCVGVGDCDEVPKNFLCVRCYRRCSARRSISNHPQSRTVLNRRSRRARNDSVSTADGNCSDAVAARKEDTREKIVTGSDSHEDNTIAIFENACVTNCSGTKREEYTCSADIIDARYVDGVCCKRTPVITKDFYKTRTSIIDSIARSDNGDKTDKEGIDGVRITFEMPPTETVNMKRLDEACVGVMMLDVDKQRPSAEDDASVITDVVMGDINDTDNNGNFEEEMMADITNRHLTDRSSGRCKADITRSMSKVRSYGSLTTVQ